MSRGAGARSRAAEEARRKAERGHLMAGLMAGVAIMLILSTVAFQAWSDLLRRDNEAEMMFRAQDIVRAIQRYRRDHGGSGPLKLELLMEPGPKGQYYLRRLYEDPLVPDGKWGLLHLGPGGQILDPNAQVDETGLSGLGGLGGLGGGLGGTGTGLGGDTGTGLGDRLNQPGGTGDSRLSPPGAIRQPGAGGGSRARGRQGGANRQGLPGSLLNPNDPTQLEGLPIIGVKTLCEEKPFRVYNGLTSYDQWLFTYFDLEAQVAGGQGRPGMGRQPGQGPGAGLPGGGQQGTRQPGTAGQGQGAFPNAPQGSGQQSRRRQ